MSVFDHEHLRIRKLIVAHWRENPELGEDAIAGILNCTVTMVRDALADTWGEPQPYCRAVRFTAAMQAFLEAESRRMHINVDDVIRLAVRRLMPP